MSGTRRCKEFLRSLDLEELKNIRVKIRRPNIPEPINEIPRIYRGLDDPKSLVIHFKQESIRGIFDREDIVVNQEFPEESVKKCLRKEKRSSSVEESGREEKSRNVSYYAESSSRHKSERGMSYRSRSRSDNRSYRNRSSSHEHSISPPRKNKLSRRSSSSERRRSRSISPRPQAKKKPGLFIPTESDYLKLKKRRANQSRSPQASHSSKKGVQHSSRSSSDRYRSPRKRSRTRSRSRRSRSSSPRSRRSRRYRSRSRHRDREIEEVVPYGNPKMAPCIFQDGKYWIPVGPAFIPRGYIPPPMYPRPFMPQMMMPRMPNLMPYRHRTPRPRQQIPIVDVATTSTIVHDEGDSKGEADKQENK